MITNIIKRDGTTVEYSRDKIVRALTKAYLEIRPGEIGDAMRGHVNRIAENVEKALSRAGRTHMSVEDVQDQVELHTMRLTVEDEVFAELARAYAVYRAKHAEQRAAKEALIPKKGKRIVLADGNERLFDIDVETRLLLGEFQDLKDVKAQAIVERADKELYDGATHKEALKALEASACTMIEFEPAYNRAAARLALRAMYAESLGLDLAPVERQHAVVAAFPDMIRSLVDYGLADKVPLLESFDLKFLAKHLVTERDYQFDYIGIRTLYDRYFVHDLKQDKRLELPQTFFMRVAMGLAFKESAHRNEWAVMFYNVLSQFDFMNSTPTLFNSALKNAQLASCFLTTVGDSIESIGLDGYLDNMLLQKYSGGLGNDYTNVRALGSIIKGTNGKSQGIVPWLKIVSDLAVAVNQGGKRKGAVCAYLETWHLDLPDYLELRKNTGDDRRRTHDMNTANWIPDLFMKRVMEDGNWTLFSPNEVPDLHDLIGSAFEVAYVAYEAKAARGEMLQHATWKAKDLWRKMLTMLFETGHPWITFKDACNVRSPQQHVGVVHSSNLCTEITLNTRLSTKDDEGETAVCNIGSINLLTHLTDDGRINEPKLRETVRTAMRMLDNVIDITMYNTAKARNSNQRHRPVGLGMMGFQDVLFKLRIPYDSPEAVQLADEIAEMVCFHAYEASTDLAVERGSYSTFKGSLWDQGILPLDTLRMLEKERGGYLDANYETYAIGSERWDQLRKKIQKQGMRNSNCCAIAPTATIGNIVGVEASIEPCFANVSVKSNMSGNFTMVNEYFVEDCKKLGIWDTTMLADVKYYGGSIQQLSRVPDELKVLYKTAGEVGAFALIDAGARRQKWIDMAQSLNLYVIEPKGKDLDAMYKRAWIKGLKTTYYLRAIEASAAESSTGRIGALIAVPAAPETPVTISADKIVPDNFEMPAPEGAACMLRPGDPGFEECEACQ